MPVFASTVNRHGPVVPTPKSVRRRSAPTNRRIVVFFPPAPRPTAVSRKQHGEASPHSGSPHETRTVRSPPRRPGFTRGAAICSAAANVRPVAEIGRPGPKSEVTPRTVTTCSVPSVRPRTNPLIVSFLRRVVSKSTGSPSTSTSHESGVPIFLWVFLALRHATKKPPARGLSCIHTGAGHWSS